MFAELLPILILQQRPQWMWLLWFAIPRVSDGYGTCRAVAAGFACMAFAERLFMLSSCSIFAFAWLSAMTMSAELVEVLQNSAKVESENRAFCDRAQKILE